MSDIVEYHRKQKERNERRAKRRAEVRKNRDARRLFIIQKARTAYDSDDIKIDSDARISEGSDGAFVQVWVFVEW